MFILISLLFQTANLATDVKMEVKQELPNGESEGSGKKANKRLSVERIYQKKTQLEHILLRPDTYIGTIERLNEQVWYLNVKILSHVDFKQFYLFSTCLFPFNDVNFRNRGCIMRRMIA